MCSVFLEATLRSLIQSGDELLGVVIATLWANVVAVIEFSYHDQGLFANTANQVYRMVYT